MIGFVVTFMYLQYALCNLKLKKKTASNKLKNITKISAISIDKSVIVAQKEA